MTSAWTLSVLSFSVLTLNLNFSSIARHRKFAQVDMLHSIEGVSFYLLNETPIKLVFFVRLVNVLIFIIAPIIPFRTAYLADRC